MVDELTPPRPDQITLLLRRTADGDMFAADELMRTVGADLRKIASIRLRRDRANHRLQATELVNEAFIRLIGMRSPHWKDRQHFIVAASCVMRRLLIDHARHSRLN